VHLGSLHCRRAAFCSICIFHRHRPKTARVLSARHFGPITPSQLLLAACSRVQQDCLPIYLNPGHRISSPRTLTPLSRVAVRRLANHRFATTPKGHGRLRDPEQRRRCPSCMNPTSLLDLSAVILSSSYHYSRVRACLLDHESVQALCQEKDGLSRCHFYAFLSIADNS